MSYIYRGLDEQDGPAKEFGVLPAGDYQFVVLECGEPYEKNDKDIIEVKLSIQPSGDWVWDRPWSGETRDGEYRDGIGRFLRSINRLPAKGEHPNWGKIVGAKGKCRLKVEAPNEFHKGERNKVHYYHAPKELNPVAAMPGKPGPVSEPMPDELRIEDQEIPF